MTVVILAEAERDAKRWSETPLGAQTGKSRSGRFGHLLLAKRR
jgi:hypothetical protein